MSIEKGRAYFRALGMEDRVQEFTVSSATVELAALALGVPLIPVHHVRGHIACHSKRKTAACSFSQPVMHA